MKRIYFFCCWRTLKIHINSGNMKNITFLNNTPTTIFIKPTMKQNYLTTPIKFLIFSLSVDGLYTFSPLSTNANLNKHQLFNYKKILNSDVGKVCSTYSDLFLYLHQCFPKHGQQNLTSNKLWPSILSNVFIIAQVFPESFH